MSYKAEIAEVMIASPGDVSAERQIVREVLNEWNVVHSRTRKALLVPVGWETHSAPELSGRAQQMINDRLLAHCDLLVGIFWTRLGSPTGVAASGTVEEIEEHRKAGKPAMLYFSKAPVSPDNLDNEQYEKLKIFKAWAKGQGLVADFVNSDDFRSRFRRDLELTLRDNTRLSKIMGGIVESNAHSESSRYARKYLSSEASQLLTAAYTYGVSISINRFQSGAFLRVGGTEFLSRESSGRDFARWVSALNELEHSGLVEAATAARDLFRVTNQGYLAAEQIVQPADRSGQPG